MSTDKKKVVVIGYGGAGSQVAAALAKRKDVAVTVVTPFEYMEISLMMTEVLATGAAEHAKALHPLLREDGVEYVVDTVTTLGDNQVTLAGGSSLPYDVCVVAVGQRIPIFYPDPSERTLEQRKAAIARVQEQVKQAQHIVVSGGGPVGVEAAADIRLRHKDKKVTIVHPQSELLSAMSEPFRKLASENVKNIGIETVFNDRVVNVENGQANLKSGSTIQCDFYLPCHPTGGNAGAFLKSGSANNRGYASVDDTFKVKGYDAVFAIGDCSDYDPAKTYPKIEDQLPVLLQNVEATVQKKPLKHHVKGASFVGQTQGPMMVAMGHGLKDGYGVGPDLPGSCLPCCCWFCCCCGGPCSTPAGPGVAKAKTDFNLSVGPKKGQGIHR